MDEREQLSKEVAELQAAIEPKRDRIRELDAAEEEGVKEKLKRVRNMKDAFSLSDLVFAATSRCPCGAGLAYPRNISAWGSWDCSDILLGRAIPKGQEGTKQHTGELPFTFYEVKSENQPSANGATTRPTE
jgi:hypothetical protein